MAIDGLMSDQLFIEQNSDLITDILLQVQEETIEQLYKLRGTKTAEEFAVFIQDLDVMQIDKTVYLDDSQVIEIYAKKEYDDKESYTEIII